LPRTTKPRLPAAEAPALSGGARSDPPSVGDETRRGVTRGVRPFAKVAPATARLGSRVDLDRAQAAEDAERAPAPDAKRASRCPQCSVVMSRSAAFCPYDGCALENAAPWDPSNDPLLGKTLGERYRIEEVLSEGSTGLVYLARHVKLDNQFAIKVLRRDLACDGSIGERLVETARAIAAVGHSNIASVSDFGEIDDRVLPHLGSDRLPYFVMEYLAGGSLADQLRDGPLSAARAASLIRQVARALAAAHDAGIVHHDLRPENIRLSADDESTQVAKVLDFGFASVIATSKRTAPGMVFGTPHYMSPEQGQGQPADHRTDIYALGVIFYQCLSGKVPFASETFMGVLAKHMFAFPDRIDERRLDSLALAPIVDRCLCKEPDERYQSVAELIADLDRALLSRKTPPSERRPSRPDTPPMPRPERAARVAPPAKTPSSRRTLWLLGLGIVVVGAVAGLYRAIGGSDAPAPVEAAPAASVVEPRRVASAPAQEPQPDAQAASSAPPAQASQPKSAPRTEAASVPKQSASPPSTPSRRGRGGDDVVDPWSP
jgi:serine/threonine-protein kinase